MLASFKLQNEEQSIDQWISTLHESQQSIKNL